MTGFHSSLHGATAAHRHLPIEFFAWNISAEQKHEYDCPRPLQNVKSEVSAREFLVNRGGDRKDQGGPQCWEQCQESLV